MILISIPILFCLLSRLALVTQRSLEWVHNDLWIWVWMASMTTPWISGVGWFKVQTAIDEFELQIDLYLQEFRCPFHLETEKCCCNLYLLAFWFFPNRSKRFSHWGNFTEKPKVAETPAAVTTVTQRPGNHAICFKIVDVHLSMSVIPSNIDRRLRFHMTGSWFDKLRQLNRVHETRLAC